VALCIRNRFLVRVRLIMVDTSCLPLEIWDLPPCPRPKAWLKRLGYFVEIISMRFPFRIISMIIRDPSQLRLIDQKLSFLRKSFSPYFPGQARLFSKPFLARSSPPAIFLASTKYLIFGRTCSFSKFHQNLLSFD